LKWIGVVYSGEPLVGYWHVNEMGRGGLEDPHDSPKKTPITKSRGAECGTLPKTDPDLARIVSAWPSLSVAARALVLDFVTDSE